MQNVIHITDDVGTQIAHIDEGNGVLYIPFDVFNEQEATVEEIRELLSLVIGIAQEKYFSVLELRSSWSKSPNKDDLTKSFKESLRRRTSEQINRDKRDLENAEESIRGYQQKLKRNYDNSIRLRNAIAQGESNANSAETKLISDLDSIVKHDKFEDVTIEGGRIILHTIPLYAYTKENKRYYMGKYSVEVNMDNSDIKFTGDNARRSYWTHKDPHPHVSGRGGTAYLGNVGGTIAELCSQYELYALALVIVDYLENVNIEDIAGRHVQNWDEVNEAGEIIKKGYVNKSASEMNGNEFECDHCGEHEDRDEAYTVYNRFDGEGETHGEELWCGGCTENEATWIEQNDEYVADRIAAEVREYFENEEEN